MSEETKDWLSGDNPDLVCLTRGGLRLDTNGPFAKTKTAVDSYLPGYAGIKGYWWILDYTRSVVSLVIKLQDGYSSEEILKDLTLRLARHLGIEWGVDFRLACRHPTIPNLAGLPFEGGIVTVVEFAVSFPEDVMEIKPFAHRR